MRILDEERDDRKGKGVMAEGERERERGDKRRESFARVAAILLKTRLLKNLDRPRKRLESPLQGTANPCLRQLSRKRRL